MCVAGLAVRAEAYSESRAEAFEKVITGTLEQQLRDHPFPDNEHLTPVILISPPDVSLPFAELETDPDPTPAAASRCTTLRGEVCAPEGCPT